MDEILNCEQYYDIRDDAADSTLVTLFRIIPHVPPSHIIRSGNLIKVNSSGRSFKRRFFLLVGSVLIYFDIAQNYQSICDAALDIGNQSAVRVAVSVLRRALISISSLSLSKLCAEQSECTWCHPSWHCHSVHRDRYELREFVLVRILDAIEVIRVHHCIFIWFII